jgi:hypothetical protein
MSDAHKTAEFIRNLPMVTSCIPHASCFFAHDITIPVRHLVDIRHLCPLSAEDIVEIVYHNERQIRRLEICRPLYLGRQK